jgi:hypothetical protein
MTLARDLAARVDSGTNLADILSSALPPDKRESTVGQESSKREEKSSDSSVSIVIAVCVHRNFKYIVLFSMSVFEYI